MVSCESSSGSVHHYLHKTLVTYSTNIDELSMRKTHKKVETYPSSSV
jgi:hypothetical protein